MAAICHWLNWSNFPIQSRNACLTQARCSAAGGSPPQPTLRILSITKDYWDLQLLELLLEMRKVTFSSDSSLKWHSLWFWTGVSRDPFGARESAWNISFDRKWGKCNQTCKQTNGVFSFASMKQDLHVADSACIIHANIGLMYPEYNIFSTSGKFLNQPGFYPSGYSI